MSGKKALLISALIVISGLGAHRKSGLLLGAGREMLTSSPSSSQSRVVGTWFEIGIEIVGFQTLLFGRWKVAE